MMLISIILPCYNSEKYLGACLNSILKQTYLNWEAICINDGSTDHTKEILDRWALKDDRIRVVNQKNSGVSAARNRGLSLVQGEYICFIDSDDIVESCFLEALLLSREIQCDLTICGFTRSMSLYNVARSCLKHTILERNVCLEKFLLDNKFNPQICCMLFKRTIIESEGLNFIIGCARGEDREFIMKYLVHVNNVHYIANPLYHYRINSDSAMSSFSLRSLTSIEASQRVAEYYKTRNIIVKGIEFEVPRTLWKFLILSIWSQQYDLYRIILQKYSVEEELRKLFSYPRFFERITSKLFVRNEWLFIRLNIVVGYLYKMKRKWMN